MEELKQQAIELRKLIKNKESEIGNPALTMDILNELGFFIENLDEEMNNYGLYFVLAHYTATNMEVK